MDNDTPRDCPDWCVNDGLDLAGHVHVSADVAGGAPDQPLMARLIGKAADSSVQVLMNGRVASVDQVDSFVGGLRLLLDRARLAEPGLGFIADLWDGADVTFSEMSAVSGIEEQRIRAQSRGGQVLTIHEFDRLALSLARVIAATTSVA